jgi:hypothetical protein
MQTMQTDARGWKRGWAGGLIRSKMQGGREREKAGVGDEKSRNGQRIQKK